MERIKRLIIRGMVVVLILMMTPHLLAVPNLIGFQGRLLDTAGNTVTGDYNITFRIYNVETGGGVLWQETQTVAVNRGTYNVLLGTVTPITLSFNVDYWLSLQVGSDSEMTPRYRMATVPYAFRAAKADDADKLGGLSASSYITTSHNHDSTYVNEGQANSVTSTMITDGTIINADISATAAIAVSKINTTGAANLVSRIIAGTSVTISPTSGVGEVTITASGGGGSGTPSDTTAALDGTSTGGSATTYSRGDHKHSIGTGSITTAHILDNTISNADISPSAAIDYSKLSGVSSSTHNHDTTYYTQSILNTAGTINTGTNPVDWSKLKNVPSGFADDSDDGGTPSDTITTLDGTSAPGTATAYSRGDHKHSIDTGAINTTMILDGTITNTDISSVSWSKLTGVPSGFADDVDDVGGGGTPATTVTALDGSSAIGSSSNYAREDHKHSIGTGAITTTMILDGTISTTDLSSGVYTGTGNATTVARSDHNHDLTYLNLTNDYGRSGVSTTLYEGTTALSDKYYNQSTLNTAGTINTGTNPVDWSKLKNVPNGFADGVDDVGGGGTAASTVTALDGSSAVGSSSNYAREDHKHFISTGAITTTMILDGTISTTDLSSGVYSGTGSATTLTRSDHNHDTTYYTQSTLNTVSSINNTSNPVDWTRLKGVPAGFADGTDDAGGNTPSDTVTTLDGTGAGGSLTTYSRSDHRHSIGTGAITSTMILDGTITTADLSSSVYSGTGSATTIPRSDHNHDSTYVNEAQASSITTTMIQDGAVTGPKLQTGLSKTASLSGNLISFSNTGVGYAVFGESSSVYSGGNITSAVAGTCYSNGAGVIGDNVSTGYAGVFINNYSTTPALYVQNNSGASGAGIYVAGYVQTTGSLIVGGNLNVTGSKTFIQPHPTDSSKEIVYVCLEGGESGTYYRGTASLTDGQAVIILPDHFGLVTNEEGITVQLTPRGECNGLYVVSASPSMIVVKELNNGQSNASFDYLINGIRKGYENHQVIRNKTAEGLIDKMSIAK